MQTLIILLITISIQVFFTHTSFATESDLDKNKIHSEIRNYILNNPELIIEAIKIYEQKSLEAQKDNLKKNIEKYKDILLNSKTSYVGGNLEGSLTIVEFIDYKCGFCKRFHPELVELIEETPEARYVIKEFPILGPESVLASKASIAVLLHHGGEVYRAFTDHLLRTNDKITFDKIISLVKQVGGDRKIVEKYIESKEVREILAENFNLAKILDIQGTPTFVIGSEVVRGYKSKEQLKDIFLKNM